MYYNFQQQVLIGTVLGGSSLVKPPKGKNYYLSMRGNNKRWLMYKVAEMPTLFRKPKMYCYDKTYRVNSSCSKLATEMHDILYKDRKRHISMSVLDCLRDIGIAIWFLDGGNKSGRNRKNAYINTTRFGEQGTNTIIQYFQEVGIPCNLNHDGKRLKVLFTVQGTQFLFKVIAHKFPEFMYFKL